MHLGFISAEARARPRRKKWRQHGKSLNLHLDQINAKLTMEVFLKKIFITDKTKHLWILHYLNITFIFFLNLKVVMPQNSVATMMMQTVFVLVQTISSSLAQLRDLKFVAKLYSFDVSFYPRILLFKFWKGCVPSDDAPKISEGTCRKRRQALPGGPSLGGPNLGGGGANPLVRVFTNHSYFFNKVTS